MKIEANVFSTPHKSAPFSDRKHNYILNNKDMKKNNTRGKLSVRAIPYHLPMKDSPPRDKSVASTDMR